MTTTTSPTERVGRYQLLEPIGIGPSGSVSRAKVFGVAGFERQFAVKRFHPELTTTAAMAAMLSAGARAYGSLEHPRIARMSEFGVAQGWTFTAVEHVVGLDALRLITEARLAGVALAAGGALALVSQAARAVGYAHGRGLTHLGLAPTNVIVTADGDIKITDFGILSATLPPRPIEATRLAQRIAYLAPEQLANEATSAATDVFALGVLAYELVTGQRTFRGESPQQIASAIMAGPPSEPMLPRPIVRVLQRCLARSPFERFPDARALADALDAALRVAPVPGTRKDIGSQVKDTLDRLAALNESQQSGMVALNFGTGPIRRLGAHELPTELPAQPPTYELGPAMPPGATLSDPPRPQMTMPGLAPPPIPVPPGVAGAQPAVPSAATAAPTMLGVGKPPPSIPAIRPVVKGIGTGIPPRPPALPAMRQTRPGTDLAIPIESPTPSALVDASEPIPQLDSSLLSLDSLTADEPAPDRAATRAEHAPLFDPIIPNVPDDRITPLTTPAVMPSEPDELDDDDPVREWMRPNDVATPVLRPGPSDKLPRLTDRRPAAADPDAGKVTAPAEDSKSGRLPAASSEDSKSGRLPASSEGSKPARLPAATEAARLPDTTKPTPPSEDSKSGRLPASSEGSKPGRLPAASEAARLPEAAKPASPSEDSKSGRLPAASEAGKPARLPPSSFEKPSKPSRPAASDGKPSPLPDAGPAAALASDASKPVYAGLAPPDANPASTLLGVTPARAPAATPAREIELPGEITGMRLEGFHAVPAPDANVDPGATEQIAMTLAAEPPHGDPLHGDPLHGDPPHGDPLHTMPSPDGTDATNGSYYPSEPAPFPYPPPGPDAPAIAPSWSGSQPLPDPASTAPPRRRLTWILIGMLGAIVVGLGGWLLFAGRPPAPPTTTVTSRPAPPTAAPSTTPPASPSTTPPASPSTTPPASPSTATASPPAPAPTSPAIAIAPSDAGTPNDASLTASPAAPIDAAPGDAGAAPAIATPTQPAAPGDSLLISSTPPGARVFLDGSDAGTTPVTLPGSPDRHTIALLLAGHELYVAQVDGRGTFQIPLKEVVPTGGQAGIKVLRCKDKDRYYVFVDGKPTGQTCPTERISTEIGPHTVEVYDVVSETRRRWDFVIKDTRLSFRIRVE